jgi:hypothetical protein
MKIKMNGLLDSKLFLLLLTITNSLAFFVERLLKRISTFIGFFECQSRIYLTSIKFEN